MEFMDRLLTCVDCGQQFVFTAGEQLFFLDKQFKNDPKRCKPCKSRRSAAAAGATSGTPVAAGISRVETRTVCSQCGVSTTVPFKPTQGRPVLCRQCYKNKGQAQAAVQAVSQPLAPALVPPAVAEPASAAADLVAAAQPLSA